MNEQEKLRTESHIKKLEEEEMRMLSTMQATMSRKQEALKELASKSKALKRGIEPRNAYVKKGQQQDTTGSENGPNSH